MTRKTRERIERLERWVSENAYSGEDIRDLKKTEQLLWVLIDTLGYRATSSGTWKLERKIKK